MKKKQKPGTVPWGTIKAWMDVRGQAPRDLDQSGFSYARQRNWHDRGVPIGAATELARHFSVSYDILLEGPDSKRNANLKENSASYQLATLDEAVIQRAIMHTLQLLRDEGALHKGLSANLLEIASECAKSFIQSESRKTNAAALISKFVNAEAIET